MYKDVINKKTITKMNVNKALAESKVKFTTIDFLITDHRTWHKHNFNCSLRRLQDGHAAIEQKLVLQEERLEEIHEKLDFVWKYY